MAETTKILWTSSTFNPWRGCTKVSPGCANCYAQTLSNRNPKVLGVWGPEGTRVLAADAQWNEPLKWEEKVKKEEEAHSLKPFFTTFLEPHYVFCASLADIFEDFPGQMVNHKGQLLWKTKGYIPTHIQASDFYPEKGLSRQPIYSLDDARNRLWDLIRSTPHLVWQLLTKRPENITAMMPSGPWPNVWLGTSVETQEYCWRIDALQEASSKIMPYLSWVSAEPLLEPIDIETTLGPNGIRWVVVGGESGSDRPFHVDWARSLISQCRRKNVPCFIKQLGSSPEYTVVKGQATPLFQVHKKGGDIQEFPQDIQIREFPV